MGEISEMYLDGTLCEECGSYIGEAVHYPRKCEDCSPRKKENNKWKK